jgi:hypothetical protein
MRTVDWLVVAAYLVWVVGDGLRQARKSRDVENFLVAGRSLPWWLVGMSVMATQLSAITMIGTTGQAYINGMRFLQNYYALPIAMVILSLTLVPFFHRPTSSRRTSISKRVSTGRSARSPRSVPVLAQLVVQRRDLRAGRRDVGDSRPQCHVDVPADRHSDHDLHDVRRRARHRLHRISSRCLPSWRAC